MEAAAGKMESNSLSLFLEAYGLEVEEERDYIHPDLGSRSLDL